MCQRIYAFDCSKLAGAFIGKDLTYVLDVQKKGVWGTDTSSDAVIDAVKVKAAIRRQEEDEAAGLERDDRKRKYNSLAGSSAGVTDEEMEAYRLRKARADDPMAQSGAAQNGYDFV